MGTAKNIKPLRFPELPTFKQLEERRQRDITKTHPVLNKLHILINKYFSDDEIHSLVFAMKYFTQAHLIYYFYEHCIYDKESEYKIGTEDN